jgi:hypothetical protein
MVELESDKRKKLTIVAFIYLTAVALICYLYHSNGDLNLDGMFQLSKEP